MKKIALPLLLSLCVPAALAGEPLVTDRPDVTESSSTVKPGSWQLETGITFSREEDFGPDVDVLQLFSTLARVGLTERLELRVGIDGWFDADAGPAGGDDGLGDTNVGIKWYLGEEKGQRPEMALIAGTTLPTGQDSFSSGKPDPFVIGAFSHTLSDDVSLGYNLGLAAESVELPFGGEETETVALGSLAVGIGLNDRWSAFTEVFGTTTLSDGDGDPIGFDTGLTYLWNDDVQLDVFVGLGINDDAADGFLGFGLSFRRGK